MSLQKLHDKESQINKVKLKEIFDKYFLTDNQEKFVEWYGHFIQKGNTTLTAAQLAKVELDK